MSDTLDTTDSEVAPAGDDMFSRHDPMVIFAQWLAEAGAAEPNDPGAAALATVDADGLPDVRMILLKGADGDGFVFYTNLGSEKGRQLSANPVAAMCFHWKTLRRQVRVRGAVVAVADAEADAYFASRPRGSRIGAWASAQSRPLESKFALEKKVAQVAAKYPLGEIPRPAHWSGYRIVPQQIEFWRDGAFRLHDRRVFRRKSHDAPWTVARLYP